jgi:hypothetical protein
MRFLGELSRVMFRLEICSAACLSIPRSWRSTARTGRRTHCIGRVPAGIVSSPRSAGAAEGLTSEGSTRCIVDQPHSSARDEDFEHLLRTSSQSHQCSGYLTGLWSVAHAHPDVLLPMQRRHLRFPVLRLFPHGAPLLPTSLHPGRPLKPLHELLQRQVFLGRAALLDADGHVLPPAREFRSRGAIPAAPPRVTVSISMREADIPLVRGTRRGSLGV